MATAKKRATAPERAVIYARISQDRADGGGVRRGLGVKRQREDCEALARAKGWEVLAVLTDNDLSAYSGKPRPDYERLLAMVEADEVDVIVAWHPDRLHRSPTELERFIIVVEAHQVAVATVEGGDYDLTSASGRQTARIVGAVARGESEHKSERIRRQREQSARAGTYTGGRRPFGYEKDGMTVREGEAKLIREAVERVFAGQSLRSIAIDWNDRGLRSTTNVEWSVTTLRSMLTGPRLAGLRVHHGEVVGEAMWPAIVGREEHERLRATLGNPRLAKRGRPPVALLSGLIRCGKCGSRMHSAASPKRPGKRYVCPVGPGGSRGCGRVAIAASPTEDIVVDAVLKALEGPALTDALRAKQTAPKGDPAAEIAVVDARLVELADLYASGAVSKAEWMRARSGLDDRRERAVKALGADVSNVAASRVRARASTLRRDWPELSPDDRRAVLAAVVDHIEVAPAATPGRYDADRLSVRWRA